MLSGLDQPKLFGIEEANRTLPLVSRIAKDIVEVHNEIQSLQREIREIRASGGTAGPEDAEQLSLRLRSKVRELDEFLQELKQIGCECKDLRLGLIDFPAQLEDRVVYFCWKLGEARIQFWHEREGGFAGRRPVGESFPLAEEDGDDVRVEDVRVEDAGEDAERS